MYCSALLYYTALLCCAILYYTTLHYSILLCSAVYTVMLCCATLQYTALLCWSTPPRSAMLHCRAALPTVLLTCAMLHLLCPPSSHWSGASSAGAVTCCGVTQMQTHCSRHPVCLALGVVARCRGSRVLAWSPLPPRSYDCALEVL